MSHLMRAQLGFYVVVASPSGKRVASKSAGYDCVNNATVREGRV